MPGYKLQVVYDCNIFWRAFFSRRGLGTECKRLIDEEIIIHFISDDIVSEITDVLSRPATLAKFPWLSMEDVQIFLKEIVSKSVLVKSVTPMFEIYRDIKTSRMLISLPRLMRILLSQPTTIFSI